MMPPPPTIDGVVWRAAVADDAEAIEELQAACFAVDDTFIETAAEIADRFESPIADADTDTLVAVRSDGSIVASLWCELVPNPVGTWKVYEDNYIHPEYRTPQICEFALRWWIERGAQRTAGIDPALPVRYHQHVYPKQEAHRDLLVANGFTPSMFLDELRRDLAEPIGTAEVPSGFRLVPFDEVPSVEALAVRNDAFRDHRGSQPWTIEMWESRSMEMHRPDASFAVMDGGRPVSYVMCAAYPQEWEKRGYSEGWIEGVGTARSHRGRGFASLLVTRAMTAFRDAGLEYATLGVDSENPTGAVGIYERLGFRKVRRMVNYTLTVEGVN
ncbi:MAG: GNAT family N-acetyltransferase [Acidimicrobiia bacterium]